MDWRPEKLVTEDRRMLCSGGVCAAMHLSLYLVEKFCCRETALKCAKARVVNMPRASQSVYAVLPLSPPHDDAKVRAAEAHMERSYAGDVSFEDLARSLNMSPRNFIRRFEAATGRGPGSYLQELRVAVAKEMPEEGARSGQTVSEAVGYGDAQFLPRRLQTLYRNDACRVSRGLHRRRRHPLLAPARGGTSAVDAAPGVIRGHVCTCMPHRR